MIILQQTHKLYKIKINNNPLKNYKTATENIMILSHEEFK
jgi:hypothetical protein